MSEIKINTSDTNTKPVRAESVPMKVREPLDVRDVDHFQALLGERVEGDQKKDSKRDSKKDETGLKESRDNLLVFGVDLGDKVGDKVEKEEVKDLGDKVGDKVEKEEVKDLGDKVGDKVEKEEV
ncbi:MAG: hypothetical protein LBR92_04345, partial [Puniceicoccales bacterium]|nr:hypothetical protein [Puniceicoccales bacterium]